MAICGSTLQSAGSLGNLDLLADSELDLTSWLFQDDLYQQDFGRGAKDMHSISSAVADYVTPPFITSQDFPDWMDATTEINWDQPLNLEECLNNDLKHQMQQQQTSSDEFQTESNRNLLVDSCLPLQVSAHQQQPEYQRVVVKKNYINDGVYFDDDPSSSEGFEDSSTSFNASHESFSVCEEKPFQLCESPFIISVPLTDVFVEQKQLAFRTINITGIEHINVDQKPVFCSTPIQSVASPSLPLKERREPQKIVINLRRITLPVASSSAPDVQVCEPVQLLPQSGPTLKEALTMDNADDFIRDMVSMPSVVPDQSFEADRQEDSVLQFSEEFEDRGFSEGFGSPSELVLFSPSSSSSLSSACGSVHSPEPYEGHSSQDDDMEEDLLSHNESLSSCASREGSSRYAPYKSLEKKLRKKEQNKRAALRYRQKKKEEEESVFGTLQAEEDKQKQLKEKYNALLMEVKLMKKLMREMLVTKGTLKN